MRKTNVSLCLALLALVFLFPADILSQEQTSAQPQELVYLKVSCVTVSSFDDTTDWAPMQNAMAPVDGDLQSRWSSKLGLDNQWIYFDFGSPKTVSKIEILWERAHAVDYEILASDDAQNWRQVTLMRNQNGELDEINFAPQAARYIKILGLKRSNPDWGISIWEIEFFGPAKLNPEDKPIGEVFPGRKPIDEELKAATTEAKKEEPFLSLGPISKNEFQKGVVYTSWGREELGSPVSDKTLEYLYNKGVRHVGIMVVWFQDTTESMFIWPDTQKDTPMDEALVHAINTCHKLGMKVMLKPHVDVKDGSWRGDISPCDEWFISYTDFITHYAQLAAEYNVELFCIGTELASATCGGYAKKWDSIIEKIKENYKGPLIYAANWNEYNYVPFWKKIDFIGIDAYFPLTTKNEPTKEELVAGWVAHADKLEKWLGKEVLDKPIIFTEIGYSSADGTNKEPWKVFSKDIKVDNQEQTDCLQALMEVLTKRSWFKGLYWWNYFPQERYNPTGFIIRGKPAEETLSNWYKQ